MKIAQTLSNLEAYLCSWTDDAAGVHGYIIHHHRDYVSVTAPACWTQGVRILGHLTLFGKTRSERWLEAAVKESGYLLSVYESDLHLYHDSTTPLTLINNAWPTLALLKTAVVLKSRGDRRYEDLKKVAFDNLDNRMIKEHWDPDAKTFYFCPPEYHAERVHSYNQNAITISALCSAAKLSGDESYVDDYALPTANHMVQDQNREKNQLKGGWGYNDGKSGHLFYYLYTALNCRGLLDLYEHTQEEKYLESAALAGKHLVNMIDDKTLLFSHRYVKKGSRVVRYLYPAMIATSGLGLCQIRRLIRYGVELDVERSISVLLDYQHPHGGFANFIGSTDIWTPELFPCEPEKRKWRDVVSVPFWNVFAYELLADMLDPDVGFPAPTVEFPCVFESDDGYTIKEDRGYVKLSKDRRTVAFFDKKKDYMLFSTEKMRGVPFGTYANTEVAAYQRLKRKVKGFGAILACALVVEALVILYLLL